MRMLLLLLCALARAEERTGPRYAHYGFTEPLRADMDGKILGNAVKDLLSTRGVTTLTVSGAGEDRQYLPRKGRTHDLKEMSPEVGKAVRLVLWKEQPGLELDVLVTPMNAATLTGMKRPRVPVTVRWEQPDRVVAEVGELFDAVDPTSTEADVQSRWGVTLQSDGVDWSAEELGLLDEALSLLSAEELAVVQAVPFRRVKKAPPANGRHSPDSPLAVFSLDPATGPRFEFYRPQVDRQRTVFRGDPDAPRSAAIGHLAHEFGHAIANGAVIIELAPVRAQIAELDAAIRQRDAVFAAGAAAEDRTAATARYEEAVLAMQLAGWPPERLFSTLERGAVDTPSELAIDALIGDRMRVSAYAETNPAEHYAEMFELYTVDPAALHRLYPDAADWFAAGSHLP